MFFRLTNSLATFQAFMNEIFKDLIWGEVVKVYMDNILVSTDTVEEHREVNRRVFQILLENKLYLKAAKCEFEKDEVEFLGVIVGNGQVWMDPKKVVVVMDWPVPKKKKDIQAFLGFCNFYRQFIKDFGKITKPLMSLTGNKEFQWGIPQQLAYEGLKEAVAVETVLFIPQDGGKFRLEADASNYAMGAVLLQYIDRKWRPVAFMSKSFNEVEQNYEIHDKEMLAIMIALDEWRQYLLRLEEEFEVWTNHLNLIYFWKPQKLN